MQNSSFPTLLNKKAKIFMSLNRLDLSIIGGSLLAASLFRISGLKALLLCLVGLILNKLIQKRLPRGFFYHIRFIKTLKWHYKLGGIRG